MCVSVCVCVLQYSLAQSNKGENGHIVAHTDNEDEPQREGEIFHISQFDHFTYDNRHDHIYRLHRNRAGNNTL